MEVSKADLDALEPVLWELMEEEGLGVFGRVPELLAGEAGQRLLEGQAWGATNKLWHSTMEPRDARLKAVVRALLCLGIRAGWMAAQRKCESVKGNGAQSRSASR